MLFAKVQSLTHNTEFVEPQAGIGITIAVLALAALVGIVWMVKSKR